MYKPIDKDQVLKLVQSKGPLIPNHIRKELNTDTVMVGAVLSQLISEGKVKVTTVKIGGSPNYYAPGSEAKLVDLIKYLNEKDRRVAEMLQEQQVMKDSDQDPLVRVSLRNIKDYAKPLEVAVKGTKEIYWKWFLLSAKDAEDLIASKVSPKKKEEKREEKKQEQVVLEQETTKQEVKQELKEETKKEEKASKQKKTKQIKEEIDKEAIQESSSNKPETPRIPTSFNTIPSSSFESQSRLARPGILLDEEKDEFFNEVRKYLEKSDVAILDYKIVKKGELDLYILVPTRLGNQEYFCKAKKKKKIAEGDLSTAYLQGQQTKLPIIFLSNGELNKKAKEMMPINFKGMLFKMI